MKGKRSLSVVCVVCVKSVGYKRKPYKISPCPNVMINKQSSQPMTLPRKYNVLCCSVFVSKGKVWRETKEARGRKRNPL